MVYDDERILGGLDWHQAGRWHDVLLSSFKSETWQVDLALGYNQDSENILNNIYSAPGNNYKTIQMLWAGHEINPTYNFSILFLNTGFQNESGEGQNYMQTFGGNFYKVQGGLQFTSTFYYQTGESIDGLNVDALMASFYGSLNLNEKLDLLFGSDYLTGDDYTLLNPEASATTNSFNPLYGTHHKFYGFMDYFYVISPHQNVGLWNSYFGMGWATSEKLKFRLVSHLFSSAANVAILQNENLDQYLGTEIDLTFALKVSPSLNINGGYSQILATERMELLKGGGDSDNFHNWIWLMVNVHPQLF